MFVVEADGIVGFSGDVDHVVVPGCVNNSEVVTFQGNWQRAEKGEDLLPHRFVGKHLRDDLAVLFALLTVEPAVVVLPMVEQDIQVVVAKHALRPARFDKTLYEVHDCRAVGASISQVTNEDQSAAIGMLPITVIAQVTHQ